MLGYICGKVLTISSPPNCSPIIHVIPSARHVTSRTHLADNKCTDWVNKEPSLPSVYATTTIPLTVCTVYDTYWGS